MTEPPSPRELVSRCRELRAPEEHRRLRFDLANVFGDTEPEQVQRRLGSLDPLRQAQGFLMLAAGAQPPEPGKLLAALATRDEDLTAAAAFCLSVHCGRDEAVLRRLLFGADEHTPPPVSEEARYHLVRFMGLSGEIGFSTVLWDLLKRQYHFFNARTVAEALERLGDPVPEEEDQWPEALRPISIVPFSSVEGIGINFDERFSGRSVCPSCRFFPCPINFEHRVGVEDCRLWNRTDPRTAGPIHDQRTKGRDFPRAGADLPDVAVSAAVAEDAMAVAEGLLAEGSSREAIPPLCTVLIQAGETNILVPVAWVRLARCLDVHGEEGLGRIAWREALALRGALATSYVKEKADLDARAALGDLPSRGAGGGSSRHKAGTYRRLSLFVLALDLYVAENLESRGESGSAWFEMGECHRELGEFALAELCMRRAARTTGDFALRERFTQEADAVRARREWDDGPGLAVELRAQERGLADRDALLGDPVVRRERAEETAVERAYWAFVLEEDDPKELAAAVLGRLRPAAPGNLLALDAELHQPIFFSLLQVAHGAVEEKHPELTPAEVRKAPLEIVLEALLATGRALCAAALLAVQHDLKPVPHKAPPPGGRAAIQAAARFQVAQLLALAEERPTPRADLVHLAESALRLLDSLPADQVEAAEEDLRRDIVAWLEALPD